MSFKKLIPFALVIAVLALAVMMIKRTEPKKTLREQSDLRVLVPKTVRNATCNKIEIIDKDKQKLVFVKKNERWQIASYLNTPMEKKKIEGLLTALSGLLGEERADDPALLADFELRDDEVARLNLYTTDLKKPQTSLLIGKSLDYRNGFVRLEGDSKVYLINQDLNQLLTLSIEDFEKRQNNWADKKIMKAPRGSITKITLKSPDGETVVEKSEETVETPPAEGEGEAGKPKTQKKITWKADGVELDQYKLNMVLNPLITMQAAKMIDITRKTELGLDQPTHFVEVTEKNGVVHSLAGIKAKEQDDYYVTTPGADVIFEVPKVKFTDIFRVQKKKTEKSD